MPTQTVNIDKVEKQLADILAAAKNGSEILIKQNGKSVARLTSIDNTKKKRIAGLNRGSIWTSPDFDEPLPDEFWSGKE